jgi:hypothetical protein
MVKIFEKVFLQVWQKNSESEVSTLLLAAVKEMDGLVLTLSIMLFLGARDAERNVAIIDGVAVGLCILAITPLVSLCAHLQRLYPASLIWGRSVVRLVLAALFLFLRPRRRMRWRPAGDS